MSDDIGLRAYIIAISAAVDANYKYQAERLKELLINQERERRRMTDPLEEALWQVSEWRTQANQLQILNNEKASEITKLKNELYDSEYRHSLMIDKWRKIRSCSEVPDTGELSS